MYHQAKGVYDCSPILKLPTDDVLSGHVAATVDDVSGERRYLSWQDTTTLSYTERRNVRGLGPVNDRARGRGFLAHTALAIGVEDHDVLGVLDQHVVGARRTEGDPGESCVARKKRRRESEHWGAGQRRVGELFRRVERRPRVIAVFDRRRATSSRPSRRSTNFGTQFVIERHTTDWWRARGKRRSTPRLRRAGAGHRDAQGECASAGESGSAHGVFGDSCDELDGAATLGIAGDTGMPSNSHRRRGRKSAPDGVEPLVWYLVTREPIATEADVLAIVRAYEGRWTIEELHMGSDGVLDGRTATRDRQCAGELPRLRHGGGVADVAPARRGPPSPEVRADQVLTPTQLTVLCGLRPRLKPDCLANEALRAIAIDGGFMGRKGDGNPGWRTLWAGF